ncbi:MAG: PASTA domain-containing protein [Armatimonadota bacterium]|nr:PASTA domain-containing protein [Armatimonadota bacterium]
MHSMTGNVLAARYELLEQIAEGLLFHVYRARDIVRSRVVTLKIVRAPYAQNAALLDALRLVLETRTRLHHPNLMALYEIDLEAQPPFFVEEFVRGLDLETRIRRTAPFTVPIAVEIMIGVVEGLHAIHSAGLVHGDLRPANVMVGSEWRVWLNGFGMRAVYQAEPSLAAVHEARVAPYTAPELFRGSAPTVASDIYACGVMLFEMIAASLPFSGETPAQIAEAHLNDPIPSLRQRNPATPRTVEGIVTKCLQKDPARRYATAMQLLNDLKAVRDALRFGKPLGWSPIELPDATGISTPTSDIFARKPTVSPPIVEEEEEEDEIPKWLRTMLRLTGALVVVGLVIGFAAWLALRFVPEERPIPQVVGKRLEEANRILREVGLEPEVRMEGYSEQYPPGVVYSVSPPEGRVVRKGSTVYLWVSKGSRFVQVPDVRNMPESQARRELENLGLAVMDAVEERKDPNVPLGYVIATVPPAGARIDRSRPIKLIVSIGAGYDTLTEIAEPSPAAAEPQPAPTPPTRVFEVKIDLTNQPERYIRIEVEDARGTRTVLDEPRAGGQLHTITIEAQGEKVRIRVYVDGQLAQELVK